MNQHSSNLCSATNDQIMTLGKIERYITLGNLRVKGILIVLEILSVKLRIETRFMNKYVTNIYPVKRQLKPLRAKPTTVRLARASDELTIPTASSQIEEKRIDSNCTEKMKQRTLKG